MTPVDHWDSGDAYERFIGRWSAQVAPRFLEWLAVRPRARWLDLGCGTGVLTRAILQLADPASVVGVDPSAAFLDLARTSVNDERVRFTRGTAERIPLADGAVDAAVCGLVLNFMPDPGAGLREMARTTTPGGIVGGYVWDYAGEMHVLGRFWDAAVAVDPAAADLREGRRFPIAAPEPLRSMFAAADLLDVRVGPIETTAVFRDFDDYWGPFLSGTGPAPAYVASLDIGGRDRLREALRSRLPVEADGTIRLPARAWAVAGRVPDRTPGADA